MKKRKKHQHIFDIQITLGCAYSFIPNLSKNISPSQLLLSCNWCPECPCPHQLWSLSDHLSSVPQYGYLCTQFKGQRNNFLGGSRFYYSFSQPRTR